MEQQHQGQSFWELPSLKGLSLSSLPKRSLGAGCLAEAPSCTIMLTLSSAGKLTRCCLDATTDTQPLLRGQLQP